MYCTEAVSHFARRQHICTWCGQAIEYGKQYWRWCSYDAGGGYSNKMHPECRDACNQECLENHDNEYQAYCNERPEVLTNEKGT